MKPLTAWLGLALALAWGPALAQVTAEGGWIRLAPPVVQSTAAYLTLVNRGPTPLRLLGARTPLAERVSLHESYTMEHQGHTMTGMRPLPYLEIPAGDRVALRPGGPHLMLEGLKRPLKAGERVELTLLFSGGRTLRLLLPVEAR